MDAEKSTIHIVGNNNPIVFQQVAEPRSSFPLWLTSLVQWLFGGWRIKK
jgi:hypothetical protein